MNALIAKALPRWRCLWPRHALGGRCYFTGQAAVRKAEGAFNSIRRLRAPVGDCGHGLDIGGDANCKGTAREGKGKGGKGRGVLVGGFDWGGGWAEMRGGALIRGRGEIGAGLKLPLGISVEAFALLLPVAPETGLTTLGVKSWRWQSCKV